MIMVMRCRFQRYYGTFTMLLVDGSSETGPFRHLSNRVFGVRNFNDTKSMKVIFFLLMFKFNVDFGNAEKN